MSMNETPGKVTVFQASPSDLKDALTVPVKRSKRRMRLLSVTAATALLVWGVGAPIASGVVAQGSMVVSGDRVRIQHPTGGVVRDLTVYEGDRVKSGQRLLRIEDPDRLALANIEAAKVFALEAELAVRTAEANGVLFTYFPQQLLEQQQDDMQERSRILEIQKRGFTARREALDGERAELQQRLVQKEAEIRAVSTRLQTNEDEVALFKEERVILEPLRKKGLITRTRIVSLERAIRTGQGEVDALRHDTDRLLASIEEIKTQIGRMEKKHTSSAVERLTVLQTELAIAKDRQEAARTTAARVSISAPVDGEIVGLTTFADGEVVRPGATLMQIVPADAKLLIRSRIEPKFSDDVVAGLPVQIRLPSLSTGSAPNLTGTVASVSGDALTDEQTGDEFFQVDVSLTEGELSKLNGFKVAPGLPVEILIETGERTALAYVLQPLTDVMFRAMRN